MAIEIGYEYVIIYKLTYKSAKTSTPSMSIYSFALRGWFSISALARSRSSLLKILPAALQNARQQRRGQTGLCKVTYLLGITSITTTPGYRVGLAMYLTMVMLRRTYHHAGICVARPLSLSNWQHLSQMRASAQVCLPSRARQEQRKP